MPADTRRGYVMSLCAVALIFASPCGATPIFTSLGPVYRLSGSAFTSGLALSGDGRVVTGSIAHDTDIAHAFRWTFESGFADLGSLPGGSTTRGWDINTDGSVIVGYGADAQLADSAWRWTAVSGIQVLDAAAGLSRAYVVSDDGTVVGGTRHEPLGAFRWTHAQGTAFLSDIGSHAPTAVFALSSDGEVAAGTCRNESGEVRGFSARTDGMSTLVPLTPGWTFNAVRGMNDDGSVLVGWGGGTFNRAFHWDVDSQLTVIAPPGSANAHSYAFNTDSAGASVVGAYTSAFGTRALLWTIAGGSVDLQTYLQQQGVALHGWTLESATDISSDGNTIVGFGFNNGQLEGWIVQIPAPGAAWFLAFVLTIQRRERRATQLPSGL